MPESNGRVLTFAEAIREALAEEMRRDERVFIMGEDVAEAGTPFKVLSGLVEEFGTGRVVDTPISEAGITGLAVGAAMTAMSMWTSPSWIAWARPPCERSTPRPRILPCVQ